MFFKEQRLKIITDDRATPPSSGSDVTDAGGNDGRAVTVLPYQLGNSPPPDSQTGGPNSRILCRRRSDLKSERCFRTGGRIAGLTRDCFMPPDSVIWLPDKIPEVIIDKVFENRSA